MNRIDKHVFARWFWALGTFVLCVWLGTSLTAQDSGNLVDPLSVVTDVAGDQEQTAPTDGGEETGGADAIDPESVPDIATFFNVDYDAWDSAASRAETVLTEASPSAFALNRLRTSLTAWREDFAAAMRENAGRIETLDSQLAALGPAPADGETEAGIITSRRDDLIAQRDDLAAPGLLAAEAHARAAGLISEIEVQLLARQTAALLERGVTPLNPAHWPAAISYFLSASLGVAEETTASLVGERWSAESIGRILWGVIFLILAGAFFMRGRAWAQVIAPQDKTGAQHAMREALATILQAIFPLIGLTALIYGLSLLDILGQRGEAILQTVPLTGSIIILAAWLGRQFFPDHDRYGPLNQPHRISAKTRKASIALAWVAALWLPYRAFLGSGDGEETAIAVLNYPFILVLSVMLFRFAVLLRHPPDPEAGDDVGSGRTRGIVGRLAQLVAIVAAVAATAGYDAAAQAIIFPAILTLGLFGVVVYLQALSNRVYDLTYASDGSRSKALVPVVTGSVLLLVSIPLIALIWGARPEDLWNYWSRFTEGFQFGDIRISPSDFITFVAIFSLGYFITGFIKNALRASVLPRTSLDLGAQDAIVAGFGYVGIFLAAVIAITSAGIDLSNLAIVAGALSVGIGFGLQTIVSNFVSGIILLIERPVSQGDWIEVGDRMGYVRSISVRSTRIETFDRSDVIVPNADLISNQVINWTRGNLAGRLILPIGVAYGTDVDKVAAILKEIAEAHPMVIMSPPPAILFLNFGADALEFEIRAILRDINFVMSVRSELNFEISRRFAEEDIEIPFAQRDIWLRNPEVLRQTGETTPRADQEPAAPPFQQTPQRDQYDGDTDADGGDGR